MSYGTSAGSRPHPTKPRHSPDPANARRRIDGTTHYHGPTHTTREHTPERTKHHQSPPYATRSKSTSDTQAFTPIATQQYTPSHTYKRSSPQHPPVTPKKRRCYSASDLERPEAAFRSSNLERPEAAFRVPKSQTLFHPARSEYRIPDATPRVGLSRTDEKCPAGAFQVNNVGFLDSGFGQSFASSHSEEDVMPAWGDDQCFRHTSEVGRADSAGDDATVFAGIMSSMFDVPSMELEEIGSQIKAEPNTLRRPDSCPELRSYFTNLCSDPDTHVPVIPEETDTFTRFLDMQHQPTFQALPYSAHAVET